MDKSVEKKYVILFAILIALTGFTFEFHSDTKASSQPLAKSEKVKLSETSPPTNQRIHF